MNVYMKNGRQSLDGDWLLEQCAEEGKTKTAPVPGSIQAAYPFYDGIARYRLSFKDELYHYPNGFVFLAFEKVDFFCEVTMNGQLLGTHTGGEESFSFDVTELIREDNDLTVRVVTPNEKETEGFLLAQTPHRNKVNLGVQPGQSIDTGGILGHVWLNSVPQVCIEDAFINPDPATGEVHLNLKIRSRKKHAQKIGLLVFEYGSDMSAMEGCHEVSLTEGSNNIETTFSVQDYKLWSFKSPTLYTLTITCGEHSYSRRFGFRRFEVKNGFFTLNGERVFLKCSHTGNVFPGGLITTSDMDMLRRDFIYAKTCGFNTIRFMAAMAREEQLDLCDELGLMVYDETMAGWNMEDGPHMEQWYQESLSFMLRRDRNHPCVTICGFLNETKYSRVYETARDSLRMARAIAPNMLFLLGSGRWDGEISTGSVSNPGSERWEALWGSEGTGDRREPRFDAPYASYVPGMGDQHLYPPFPQSVQMDDFLLNLGKGEKPVFLSEYGHGSQNDVVQEYRKFLEHGMDPEGEDASEYRRMAEKLQSAFERYHMESAYSNLEDFLQDTMREHGKLRLRNLDCVRSNPNLCGYNITGLLDHALTGEGLWTYWREFKSGIVDVVRDGWAPLRWGVLLDNTLWSPEKKERVRVFLANEDVLPCGQYFAIFQIRGPKGLMFEKQLEIVLPEDKPLAVPVMEDYLAFDIPGQYEISLQMPAAAPIGGRRSFRVGTPLAARNYTVWTEGMTDEQCKKISGFGLQVRKGIPEEKGLILVGSMEKDSPENRRKRVTMITEAVLRGCNAVYMDGSVFKKGDCNEAFLPLSSKGCCYSFYNWLYHVDGMCRRDGLLSGICEGVLDSEALGPVYPDRIFEDIEETEECDCAMLGCGLPRDGGTYTGLALGAYRLVHGSMVLNAFRILENLGSRYAADRLLLNIVDKYYVEGCLEELPEDARSILGRIAE